MSLTNTSSTSSLSQTSPSKKQRRSSRSRRVSFSSMAEVYEIESTSNSTDQENDAESSDLWYTPRDYKAIKKQCFTTVKRKLALDAGKYNANDGDCECRGLERLMDPRVTKAIVVNAIRAVTREQTRQRLDGDEGEDDAVLFLAEVYSAYTRHSTIRARRFGLFDAKEARTAIRSDWNNESASSCDKEQEKEEPQQQQEKKEQPTTVAKTLKSRYSKSTRSHSADRLPLQGNIKLTLTNMVTRRRRAWI